MLQAIQNMFKNDSGFTLVPGFRGKINSGSIAILEIN